MPARRHPAGARSADPDGIKRTEQPRAGQRSVRWLLGLALTVLGACLALSLWLAYAPETGTPIAEASPPRSLAHPPPPSPEPPRPTPAPARVASRPTRAVATPGPVSTAPPEEVPHEPPAPEPAADTGGPSGLGLFVPGTKPIKRGIVVPDDFEVPPGYLRHFQTTDEGEQLSAILMFHPDHKPVDANGDPVPLPPDRVVPPEMAPPGLPIKLLELPKGEGGGDPPQ